MASTRNIHGQAEIFSPHTTQAAFGHDEEPLRELVWPASPSSIPTAKCMLPTNLSDTVRHLCRYNPYICDQVVHSEPFRQFNRFLRLNAVRFEISQKSSQQNFFLRVLRLLDGCGTYIRGCLQGPFNTRHSAVDYACSYWPEIFFAGAESGV